LVGPAALQAKEKQGVMIWDGMVGGLWVRCQKPPGVEGWLPEWQVGEGGAKNAVSVEKNGVLKIFLDF